jgi:soluble lytic murein transglycosylase-like protein
MTKPEWMKTWDVGTSEMIDAISKEMGFDSSWAKAIIQTESSGNALAVRYEPQWRYVLDVPGYAKFLGLTEDTERVCQSMSWGLTQIMGSVAREHGYKGHLPKLIHRDLNIRSGIVHMKGFREKYPNALDWVSSYNQGNPGKAESGKYYNQVYVDRVLGFWQDITGY